MVASMNNMIRAEILEYLGMAFEIQKKKLSNEGKLTIFLDTWEANYKLELSNLERSCNRADCIDNFDMNSSIQNEALTKIFNQMGKTFEC